MLLDLRRLCRTWAASGGALNRQRRKNLASEILRLYVDDSARSCYARAMTNPVRIFPRWASSWGALARSNALVRSQCRCCGIQQRVDAGVQAVRFGASSSPVDLLDRCTVVACHGDTFFMVARSYGRQWISMVARDDLRAALAYAAPAANAQSLDLLPDVKRAMK